MRTFQPERVSTRVFYCLLPMEQIEPSPYGYRWQKAREGYLRKHPLCKHCMAQHPPRITLATVVDHDIPHKGDMALFWDSGNWQSLCKTCHDSWKQAMERGSLDTACNEAGLPLDPRHPWNKHGGAG